MLRFNTWGLVMLGVSAVVAALGGLVFRLQDQVVMVAAGLSLVVFDLVLRLRVRDVPGWWRQGQFGGVLFSLPGWGTGLVILVINVVVAMTS